MKYVIVLLLSLLTILPVSAVRAEAPDQGTASILVLGDSLSGAYGIDRAQGWVTLLQQKLHAEGYDFHVINASVSGDTTRTGLGRIGSALTTHKPDIAIIALGGNDGLRGLPFGEIENSLASIIERCRSAGTRVLLVGVRLPPNYGRAYTEKFAGIYKNLAERYQVPLVARVLEDIAEHAELMQQDGIHPTAEAQPKVMMNIWSGLEPMLKK